ncbi:MAG: helix-turn-helix domain-containing protein [Eubacteriales bacterium]|nr:helix-turn-helix domain-containing protein [Eubacteriales bacterium]MDD4327618.1 helix-turn-helix domain-containing protein [Eubacteriales bacterium]MDD4717418.1 helix-turn-helix domain-containing protein [Eubacteriales bacterium]NCU26119.1 helix-turn-helix domain-containing protein [Candidatus Nomurabacteria bacterium]
MDVIDFGANLGNDNFDFSEAIKAADTFRRSTGVTCRVVDSVGETVYISADDKSDVAVCNLTAKYFYCGSDDCGNNETMANICLNSHLYGCYQSERFGGKYVFFCPLGLTNWASPIVCDSTVEGAFLAGPVNMVEPDEFFTDDFLSKYGLTHTAVKEIEQCIKTVPFVMPSKVNFYSELLYYIAKAVSDDTFQIIDERKAKGEQQSEIAEQIKFLKSFSPNPEYEPYPMEKEQELLELIETGDKHGSQRVLNEILGQIFFASGGSFEVIRSRVLELVVLLSRAAIKGGADSQQIFGLNYTYLGRINSFKNIEELTYWLSGIMARFTDQVFNLTDVKHVDVIYRAVDYVRKNYDRRITLEETAANVYLSPAYFSRIFKEEIGDNFNLYVNKIRIDAAKKLLLNEKIPLVDISTMVGFEGQSYFSKVFKKMTGVTPGKFREARGKIRGDAGARRLK